MKAKYFMTLLLQNFWRCMDLTLGVVVKIDQGLG